MKTFLECANSDCEEVLYRGNFFYCPIVDKQMCQKCFGKCDKCNDIDCMRLVVDRPRLYNEDIMGF